MIEILNFALLFTRTICYQPLCPKCIVIDALKILKDIIFVDEKLPAKAVKIASLKNLYAYNMSCLGKLF